MYSSRAYPVSAENFGNRDLLCWGEAKLVAVVLNGRNNIFPADHCHNNSKPAFISGPRFLRDNYNLSIQARNGAGRVKRRAARIDRCLVGKTLKNDGTGMRGEKAIVQGGTSGRQGAG